MKRTIRIYKSFEEQELDALAEMRRSTVEDRFANLYQLQELTKQFHPSKDDIRKIIIVHEPAE